MPWVSWAPCGAVGEQAAERADDGIDRLSAERGKAVDQRDLAAETCRFERGGHSGDAGAQHADIGADTRRGVPSEALRTIRVAVESFAASALFLGGWLDVTDARYRSLSDR